jgi:hypothetical protein
MLQNAESTQSAQDLQGKLKAAASAVAKTWALLTPIYGNRQPVPITSAYALSPHLLVIAPVVAACVGGISLLAYAPKAPQDAPRR